MSFTPYASPFQPLEEAYPASLVLLHPLVGAQNFTEAVLVYCNRYQNGHILVLSAPVAAQIDAVHIDIWVFAALQGAVAPGHRLSCSVH